MNLYAQQLRDLLNPELCILEHELEEVTQPLLKLHQIFVEEYIDFKFIISNLLKVNSLEELQSFINSRPLEVAKFLESFSRWQKRDEYLMKLRGTKYCTY